MPTLKESLHDVIIRHQVYLQRYGGGVANRMIALLNRADRDLIDQITRRLARLAERGYDSGPATTARLEAILKDLRVLNKAAYEEFGKELTRELREFVQYEAQWTASMMNGQLTAAASFEAIPVRSVAAAALSRPFQGRLLSEALAGLEAGKAAKVRDAIRLGFVEGETIDQMVRRLRGTRANGYADGLLEVTRREAQALVRTSVNHMGSYARESLYQENADIISAETWTATLDSRTCLTCSALDGQRFEAGKGPRTPRHHGCRCVRLPVMADEFLQGFLDGEERASQDGPVSATLTYGDWLKKQGAEFQDEVLGPTRGKLFRRGGLTVDKFTDRAGNELNLAQLRKLQPAAFERAGLAA